MQIEKKPYERPEAFPVEMETEVLQAVSQQTDPLGGVRDDFDWILW